MKNESLSIMLIILAVLLLNTEVEPNKAPLIPAKHSMDSTDSTQIVAPNVEQPIKNNYNNLIECCTKTDPSGNEKTCFAINGDCSFCAKSC